MCASESVTSPFFLTIDVGGKQPPLGLMGLGEARKQGVCLCLMRKFLVGLTHGGPWTADMGL